MGLLYRGGAEIAGLALGILATLWVTRAVGPTYFGYYAVMVTIITLGSLLINLGLVNVGSQRVANDRDRSGEVLWVVTATRVIPAAIAVVGGLLVLAIAPIDHILQGYLQIGLLVWALSPFANSWVFVAQGRLRVVSALRLGTAATTAMTALLLIRGESDAHLVPWTLVLGTLVGAVVSTLLGYRSSPFQRPTEAPIPEVVRAYLRDGLHYLKADLSSYIFLSSDRLFLYAFAAPFVVGLYAAAYSLIQPFYLIGGVVWDVMYLPIARTFGTSRLYGTFRRYVDLNCFALMPIGFFLLAFAPSVVGVFYGDKYAGSAEYLSILGWVITFGTTSGIAVLPFTAWNRPREYGNSTALGGALNLGLNAALIPVFGGVGAAWATVAAKVAITVFGIRYFRRASDYPIVRDILEYLGISAVAFMAAIATFRSAPGNVIVAMVAFGATYVALVAIVRWRQTILSMS
jgi:O-antigen/teichoic acid export membrane protein